jgi:hypothetical protein
VRCTYRIRGITGITDICKRYGIINSTTEWTKWKFVFDFEID